MFTSLPGAAALSFETCSLHVRFSCARVQPPAGCMSKSSRVLSFYAQSLHAFSVRVCRPAGRNESASNISVAACLPPRRAPLLGPNRRELCPLQNDTTPGSLKVRLFSPAGRPTPLPRQGCAPGAARGWAAKQQSPTAPVAPPQKRTRLYNVQRGVTPTATTATRCTLAPLHPKTSRPRQDARGPR